MDQEMMKILVEIFLLSRKCKYIYYLFSKKKKIQSIVMQEMKEKKKKKNNGKSLWNFFFISYFYK